MNTSYHRDSLCCVSHEQGKLLSEAPGRELNRLDDTK